MYWSVHFVYIPIILSSRVVWITEIRSMVNTSMTIKLLWVSYVERSSQCCHAGVWYGSSRFWLVLCIRWIVHFDSEKQIGLSNLSKIVSFESHNPYRTWINWATSDFLKSRKFQILSSCDETSLLFFPQQQKKLKPYPLILCYWKSV